MRKLRPGGVNAGARASVEAEVDGGGSEAAFEVRSPVAKSVLAQVSSP